MNTRDATKWPNCSCGTTWRQSGNRTGHCGSCHRTFQGATAFDRHRSDGWCIDPASMFRNLSDGTRQSVYEATIGNGDHDAGVTYWSLWSSPESRAAFAELNEKRKGSAA